MIPRFILPQVHIVYIVTSDSTKKNGDLFGNMDY